MTGLAASFIAIAVTALAVAALLVAEYEKSLVAKVLFKPIASGGFVALAITVGAADTPYGRAVLVALSFSWLGDVLLISRGNPLVFKAGVVAFLAAHLAFIAAFALRGVSWVYALIALAMMAPIGFVIARWLLGRVQPSLRMAVATYIAVISVMVPTALGTVALHGELLILVAAVAFYFSDLSVALDRFVSPGFVNRLWGLPLYYAAQIVFAWTASRP